MKQTTALRIRLVAIITIAAPSTSTLSAGFVPYMEIIASVRRPFGFVRNGSDGFEGVVDGKEKNECFSSSSINVRANAEAMITHEDLILRRRKILSMMAISIPVPFFFGVPASFANDQPEQPSQTVETMETMESLESLESLEEPKECRNGGIVSESAVPGAYEQSCMDLKGRSFPLKTSGDTITVYQGTGSAGGLAGRTGVAVWNSGVLLTRLLDEACRSNPSLLDGKTVLELGCGAGLASVAAARLGARRVIATDGNPEVLDLARRNIERNGASGAAETRALRWGAMDASECDGAADVVIGSDLTYNSGSWVVLAETMSTVLKPGGIVIYLSLGHSGFNVGGEMGGFLSVTSNVGLQPITNGSAEWRDSIGSRSSEDLISSIITPEEKRAIDDNGGVRVVVFGKKKYVRRS